MFSCQSVLITKALLFLFLGSISAVTIQIFRQESLTFSFGSPPSFRGMNGPRNLYSDCPNNNVPNNTLPNNLVHLFLFFLKWIAETFQGYKIMDFSHTIASDSFCDVE